MIVLFDGLDNTGKTTQISKLVSYLANKQDTISTVCKYSKFEKLNKSKEESFSKKFYKDYFKKITDWSDSMKPDPALIGNSEYMRYIHDNNLILDRGHISEAVYADMYRSYSGDYVFELEQCLKDKYNMYLIVLVDSSSGILDREDGLSLSEANEDKIKEEYSRFLAAYTKSCIVNKIFIDINGLDADQVFSQIVGFLNI